MSQRIHGRNPMVGSGMLNQPERLEDLDETRARHERMTRGKPARSFREVFEEKLKVHARRQDDEAPEQGEAEQEGEAPAEEEEGADALLGLAPGQSSALANPSQGRRSGKVIIKG